MSQFSCDICSFDSYDAALWAARNPWFRDCSSLAGALGEQEIGGEAPRAQISHCFLGDIFWGSQYPPAPEPTVQAPRPESVPGPSGSGEPPENGNGTSEDEGEEYGDDDDNDDDNDDNDNDDDDDDFGTIVDLRGQLACFCRVGNCLYWHTDPKQVRRHRNNHFRDRFSYHCPNRTGTCPSELHKFGRRDGVNVHCERFPACGQVFQANGGQILLRGRPADDGDLVPYDPDFHKPYRSSDGRTRRKR